MPFNLIKSVCSYTHRNITLSTRVTGWFCVQFLIMNNNYAPGLHMWFDLQPCDLNFYDETTPAFFPYPLPTCYHHFLASIWETLKQCIIKLREFCMVWLCFGFYIQHGRTHFIKMWSLSNQQDDWHA